MSIEARIKEVFASQFHTNAADIKSEMSIADLGGDSLDEIELVMAIENEFEIQIADNDADRIKTVQQAIDFVAAMVPA